MIDKVRLVNWRSHLNSELNFVTGTNALLGHIGSGKSSILDSICFAFFGTFPSLQSRKLKLDEVIMSKPSEKDRAEVEVSFQIDGKPYSVRRVIERRKGTVYSEIRENGKLLEAPSTQRVNEFVQNVLKIDYELFNKAIYAEQNSLDYFLSIPKGQRMKKIDELLMISKFEKARANSTSLINKIMDRKLSKQTLIEQANVGSLENNVQELATSLSKIRMDKKILEQTLESTTAERLELENESSELRKSVKEVEALKSEEASISSVENEINAALNSMKGVADTSPEYLEGELRNIKRLGQEYEEVLYEKQRQFSKLQDQVSRLKAEIDVIKSDRIAKLQSEIENQTRIKKEFSELKKMLGDDAEKNLDEKRLELEKYVGEAEALKIKIKEQQEALEQLGSLGAKCPICEHRLTQEKKIILVKQKRAQIESMMDSLTKAIKKREKSSKELKEMEAAAKSIETLTLRIRNLDELEKELQSYKNILIVQSESYEKSNKELRQLDLETNGIQKEFSELIKRKQETEILYMKSRDFVEKGKRLNELQSKKQILQRKIRDIEGQLSGREMTQIEFKLRTLSADERELSTKIKSLNEIFGERERRLKDLENTLSMMNKEKMEIQRLEKLVEDLQIFGKALEQTQIELRREFVASVNYTMNKIWQTLYPYQDFPNIRIAIEEGDYILQLQPKAGDWINVEGVVSGGERSLSALALRIAFSLVLAPQLRMLILDEPTPNLDAKAISELAVTLRERIGDFIDQTFLITHTPELENAVNGMAYRLERDKSVDEPTKVIQLN